MTLLLIDEQDGESWKFIGGTERKLLCKYENRLLMPFNSKNMLLSEFVSAATQWA